MALIAVSGIATASFAFNGNGEGPPGDRCPGNAVNMSDKERAEWQEDREARRAEAQEHRRAMEDTLESGDYDAWQEAVGDNCPMAGEIDEDDFSDLMEAHNFREQAREIMEEKGIDDCPAKCHMMGGSGGMGHKGGWR